MSGRRRVMAVRVDEARVLLVAVAAGLVAAFSGAEPTGGRIVDIVLTAAAVTFVAWAGASANWWMLAVTAGLATAISADPLLAAIGLVVLAAAFVVGSRQRSQAPARAALAGGVMNVVVRSELEVVFGLTAVFGVVIAVALVIDGLLRRRQRIRVIGLVLAASVIGLGTIASVLLVVTTTRAWNDVETAEDLVREGIDALGSGDDDRAREVLDTAGRLLSDVEDLVSSPVTAPSALVPVAAQHRRALVELSERAGETSRILADELSAFDIDSIRLVDGAVDVESIRSLQDPLDTILMALTDLEATVLTARDPWLLDRVEDRLDSLADELAAQRRRGEDVAQALAVAPAMLGGDGPRTYLVAFLTPAEARGGVGFMGSLAELSVIDGRIRIAEYWNTGELNPSGSAVLVDEAPADWLERYGIYGFTSGPGGRAEDGAWSNVTLSPHFPSTAQVMRELYREGLGPDTDGVFALDVTTMAAILQITGPIEVTSTTGPLTLTADNLEQFLLVDQYRLAEEDSQDVLEQVGRSTLDALLEGTLPSPSSIADTIGPAVREGRLTAWSRHATEQTLFRDRAMSGELPDLDDAVGFSVALNNGNPSKIDGFLEVDIEHRVSITTTDDTGTTRTASTVTISNTVTDADLQELPDVVVGNQFGLPRGTNRSLIEIFTSSPVDVVTIDGEPVDVTVGTEAGWATTSVFVDIPPGATVVLVVSGQEESRRFATVRLPALVRPVDAQVVVDRDGRVTAFDLEEAGVTNIPL